MHGYSTDSDERRVVPLFLALVAISLAWLSSKFFAVVPLSITWWVDAPFLMTFYGVLYTLFDRHLWRNGFACKLGLVKIPNLAGCWRGYLISSFDGHARRHNLVINIFQTWTQLAVFLATTTSISRSFPALIQFTDTDGIPLSYPYQNQPLVGPANSMPMHFVTATLRVSKR